MALYRNRSFSSYTLLNGSYRSITILAIRLILRAEPSEPSERPLTPLSEQDGVSARLGSGSERADPSFAAERRAGKRETRLPRLVSIPERMELVWGGGGFHGNEFEYGISDDLYYHGNKCIYIRSLPANPPTSTPFLDLPNHASFRCYGDVIANIQRRPIPRQTHEVFCGHQVGSSKMFGGVDKSISNLLLNLSRCICSYHPIIKVDSTTFSLTRCQHD